MTLSHPEIHVSVRSLADNNDDDDGFPATIEAELRLEDGSTVSSVLKRNYALHDDIPFTVDGEAQEIAEEHRNVRFLSKY